jgi:biotin synthase
MSFTSLRSLSARAIQISNTNKNAALLQCTRLYTVASNPAKFATIDESTSAQKQMAFGRDLSGAASNAHGELRYDWKKEEIEAIYHSPIMELLYHGVSLLYSLFLGALVAGSCCCSRLSFFLFFPFVSCLYSPCWLLSLQS